MCTKLFGRFFEKSREEKRQRGKIKKRFHCLNNTPGGPFMDSDVPSSSPVPSEERSHDSKCIKVHLFFSGYNILFILTTTRKDRFRDSTQTVCQPFGSSPPSPHKLSAIWLSGRNSTRPDQYTLRPTAHTSEYSTVKEG